MKPPVQFSAIVETVKANKDRTITVKLGTQELSAKEMGLLLDMMGELIWVAFCETEVQVDDLNIPEVLSEFKTDKSPSQRLRDILWVYWDKKKKGSIDWDAYYRREVEKIIAYLKEKLE